MSWCLTSWAWPAPVDLAEVDGASDEPVSSVVVDLRDSIPVEVRSSVDVWRGGVCGLGGLEVIFGLSAGAWPCG